MEVGIKGKTVYAIGVVAVATIGVVSWYTFQDRYGNKQASAATSTQPVASAIQGNSTAAPEPAKWMFISPDRIELLKTKVSSGDVNNNADLLGDIYGYGISVRPDNALAKKYYKLSEEFAKSNDYKSEVSRLAVVQFLLTNSGKTNSNATDGSFIKQREDEFIKTADSWCANKQDKQEHLACALQRLSGVGLLNVLAVEWAKGQGADFSNANFATYLSEAASRNKSRIEMDAWLRLIDYGFNPNTVFNDRYRNITLTLLESSIDCNETFADFRLAAKLVETGANVNEGTYGPIARLINQCPELDLTNTFIKAMVDKGLDPNRVITVFRTKQRMPVSEAVANSGSIKLAGLFAAAGGNINMSAVQEKQDKIALLEQRAKAGDIEAMVTLGSMYLNGEGVPKNKSLASPYIKKAAQAGNAQAQWYMTWLDDTPIGEHMSWITKSAEQGYSAAEFQMGKSYEDSGQLEKAKYWYRRSEEHGMSMSGRSVAQIDKKQDVGAIKGSSAVCQGYRDQMNALSSGDRLVDSYQRQQILDSAQKYGCL
ncbi:MAG: hypothetical protein PHC51_02475 [bacterium]|nr:hypothetical protein [bacterium]MDD2941810.1 hypothetical protein [bacterium]